MSFSSIFIALGFAALSIASPTYQTYGTATELADLWQHEVNSYVRTYDSSKWIELQLNLSTVSSSLATCEDVFLVFTRGTFEPAADKNLGIMVGMPFASALSSALGAGRFGAIGVDYNNGVLGYLSGGDSGGAVTMGKLITDKAAACPRTKIVASGYR
jgi:hypothetical protein